MIFPGLEILSSFFKVLEVFQKQWNRLSCNRPRFINFLNAIMKIHRRQIAPKKIEEFQRNSKPNDDETKFEHWLLPDEWYRFHF